MYKTKLLKKINDEILTQNITKKYSNHLIVDAICFIYNGSLKDYIEYQNVIFSYLNTLDYPIVFKETSLNIVITIDINKHRKYVISKLI